MDRGRLTVLTSAGEARVPPAAQLGDREGLDALRALIGPGRTAAMVGPSGVGKSSLLNALAGRPLAVTREIRESDGRGRHTTTARELHALPGGGLLIDTPGLRELALHDDAEGFATAYADLEDLAAG